MSTYQCRKCGVRKNDTVNSQLNTSITCTAGAKPKKMAFHSWEMISEEDID